MKKYYFMFVSGSFNGDIAAKLNKIFLETSVSGTAMPIITALLLADNIKSKKITHKMLAEKICCTEFSI